MTHPLCCALAALLCLAAVPAAAATSLDATQFLRSPATAPDAVRLSGVRTAAGSVTLDLRRFEVFARGADLRADDGHGHVRRLPRPATRYYTGRVEGGTGGSVFLALEPDGSARGIVDRVGTAAALEVDAARGLRLVDIDTSAPRSDGGFRCGSEELEQARALIEHARTEQPAGAARRDARPYRARVAIETDYEFFNKFTDEQHALAYVGDLMAYASTKYQAELNTRFELVFVRLWTTTDDPWMAESSSLCNLYAFGYYWNTHMTGVSRSFAHMLSGRAPMAGIAWTGALCHAPFDQSSGCAFATGTLSVGGDYGFSGGMSGTYVAGAPQVLWDSYAPLHEIGHNFSSPHTHCYAGIGGNAEPVDQCYGAESACYAGVRSLPGPAGQGSGTIMSYCHLMSPGLSNLTMTFGAGHPYGVAPERVPAKIGGYLDALAQSNPACIVDDTVFADDFE